MKQIFFILAAALAAFAGDTLVISPESPTTKDSVELRLYSDSLCCCTQYLNPFLSLQDSTLTLVYTPNATPCLLCDCFAAGSWVTFKSAPLKAGAYNVYKQEIPYCPPGQVCPAFVPAPVKMGRFTVKQFANIEKGRTLSALPMEISPNPFRTSTLISFANPTSPSYLAIFDVKGTKVAEFTNLNNSRVSWNAADQAGGIYIVKATAGKKMFTGTMLLQK
jgi:hypothetical protein